MSMLSGSSASRVVMVKSSVSRPTLRPTTTGVSGGHSSSKSSRAWMICSRRVRDAGL